MGSIVTFTGSKIVAPPKDTINNTHRATTAPRLLFITPIRLTFNKILPYAVTLFFENAKSAIFGSIRDELTS